MKPAELIASVDGNAPEGCYHIKIVFRPTGTRISNSGTLSPTGRKTAHLTLLNGKWDGLSLETEASNEYVSADCLHEEISRNEVRRVDYLCHPASK